MTPEVLSIIREAEQRNEISVLENDSVISVRKMESTWKVALKGSEIETNFIWLCTGTKLDFQNEPILKDILKVFPATTHRGIPLLDENLRIPGSEVYVTGRYAAYGVGPEAANLGGSLIAARMVVDSLLNICGLDCEAHKANFRRRNKNKDQNAGRLRKK